MDRRHPVGMSVTLFWKDEEAIMSVPARCRRSIEINVSKKPRLTRLAYARGSSGGINAWLANSAFIILPSLPHLLPVQNLAPILISVPFHTTIGPGDVTAAEVSVDGFVEQHEFLGIF